MKLEHSHLGKQSVQVNQYTPDLLFPIPRQTKRDEIGISNNQLPFYGYDFWNAFEISWLNSSGKPMVATAGFVVPVNSKYIVESKSLKLYLNSFNQTHFDKTETVEKLITEDLSSALQCEVGVHFELLNENKLSGQCIDDQDVQIDTYHPNCNFLTTDHDAQTVTESLHSHLLRSNCPVTGQPDFGSIQIEYTGPQINHAGLLKYIVSYRNHDEFHEQCVERIFIDILSRCKPSELTVCARYTRRGGIDINPYRSTNPDIKIQNLRLTRQ